VWTIGEKGKLGKTLNKKEEGFSLKKNANSQPRAAWNVKMEGRYQHKEVLKGKGEKEEKGHRFLEESLDYKGE